MFGSNDPLVYSSVALYNTCDQDTAQLYDHGLGHLVPRDADNVEQLGDVLSDVITRINKASEKDKVAAESVSASDTEPSVDEYNDESSATGPSSATSGDESSDLDSRSSNNVGPQA